MSWTGNNLKAIQAALRHFEITPTCNNAVGVASAYYSGVGTMYIKWRQNPWRFDYLIKSLWWRSRALAYAVPSAQTFLSDLQFSDEEKPTADSVDVLCSVFYRLGRGRHNKEAKALLSYINSKPPAWSWHTRSFLLMHEVRFGMKVMTDELEKEVVSLAKSIVHGAALEHSDGGDISLYGQVSRIYRNLANLLPDSHPRRAQYLKKSFDLAKRFNVVDQVLKAQ
jgi:hypothetical protein